MYLLMIDHGDLVEPVVHQNWEDAIREAIDHEMGEYSGTQVMGVVEVVAASIVANAIVRHDAWDQIREGCRERPDWQKHVNASRWEVEKHES